MGIESRLKGREDVGVGRVVDEVHPLEWIALEIEELLGRTGLVPGLVRLLGEQVLPRPIPAARAPLVYREVADELVALGAHGPGRPLAAVALHLRKQGVRRSP